MAIANIKAIGEIFNKSKISFQMHILHTTCFWNLQQKKWKLLITLIIFFHHATEYCDWDECWDISVEFIYFNDVKLMRSDHCVYWICAD